MKNPAARLLLAESAAMETDRDPSNLDAAAGLVMETMRGMCIGGRAPTLSRRYRALATALGLLVNAGAVPAFPLSDPRR